MEKTWACTVTAQKCEVTAPKCTVTAQRLINNGKWTKTRTFWELKLVCKCKSSWLKFESLEIVLHHLWPSKVTSACMLETVGHLFSCQSNLLCYYDCNKKINYFL